MHPPLGESPKTESTSVFQKVGSVGSSMYNTVVTGVQKAANTVAPSKPKEPAVTPEMKQRNENIEKLTKKLHDRFTAVEGYFEKDQTEINLHDNYMTHSKTELEENGMKLKKQILVLENETEEMKSKITEMKQFVSKHYGKEVTKVSCVVYHIRTTLMISFARQNKTRNQC